MLLSNISYPFNKQYYLCEATATSLSKQPDFLNATVRLMTSTNSRFIFAFTVLLRRSWFYNWCFGNISLWDQINIMVCDANLPRLAEQHPKSLKSDIYKSWQGPDVFLLPAQPLFLHSRPSDSNQEQLQACESLAFACLQSSLLCALKVWCQCRDICLSTGLFTRSKPVRLRILPKSHGLYLYLYANLWHTILKKI